jgi:class 3 adenylate cyclase
MLRTCSQSRTPTAGDGVNIAARPQGIANPGAIRLYELADWHD